MEVSQFTKAITMILAISVDAFTASFSYGAERIKIPPISVLIIHLVNVFFIYFSIFVGKRLTECIPMSLIKYICFAILTLMAVAKLLDGIIKSHLNNKTLKKDITFSLLSAHFILSVYINPKNADADCSKLLSTKEAIVLATSLSADSIPIGINFGLSSFSPIFAISFLVIINEIAIHFGNFIGKKASEKLLPDISWIGGVVLLLLAILKLI